MKKNFVTLLFLIPILWISCDGIDRPAIDFQRIEALMPHHPDSALTLLEQIKDKEALSRKDKAHYYLLLTEAHDKAYVTHTTDSLISIAADYYEKTDDLGRKAKAWYYRGRVNQDLGHPLKAQEYYLKALRDEEEIEDHALLGRINNHIGMLYTYQTVYEKALPFQKKAVENFHLLNEMGIFDNDRLICHDGYLSFDKEEKKRNFFMLVSKQNGSIEEIPIPYEKVKTELILKQIDGKTRDWSIRNKKLIPYEDAWLVTELSADTIYKYSSGM